MALGAPSSSWQHMGAQLLLGRCQPGVSSMVPLVQGPHSVSAESQEATILPGDPCPEPWAQLRTDPQRAGAKTGRLRPKASEGKAGSNTGEPIMLRASSACHRDNPRLKQQLGNELCVPGGNQQTCIPGEKVA